MPTSKPRYIVTVDDELNDQIQDFRYRNRFPTMNMALNELLKAGVMATKDDTPDLSEKHTYRSPNKHHA